MNKVDRRTKSLSRQKQLQEISPLIVRDQNLDTEKSRLIQKKVISQSSSSQSSFDPSPSTTPSYANMSPQDASYTNE